MNDASALRRFPTLRALATALLALAAALPAAAPAWAAPEAPSVRRRDAAYKYSVWLFQDWRQVPLETQGKDPSADPIGRFRVARYLQNDEKGRGADAGLEIFRIDHAAAPVTTPTSPPPAKPGAKPATPPKVEFASMEALFDRLLNLFDLPGLPKDPKQSKAVKSKDGVPGRTWTYTPPRRGLYFVFATWKKDDVEFGMWVQCDPALRKKYETGIGQVVSGFQFVDDRAGEVRSLDALDGLNLSPAKRREIEMGLLSSWDVIASPEKNYVVLYDRKGKRNDRLARIVAERIEAIRAQVYEKQFPPAQPVKAVSIVRLCADAAGYHAYGGPPGTAGYWNDDAEELVFYDMDDRRDVADDDTLSVLYHEAFHQFIYYSVGEVAPHSWFNEGHGDYYAGSRIKDGAFTVKPFRWRVAVVKDAIKHGPCPFDETKDKDGHRFTFDRSCGGYSPLKALVSMSQREYYSYPRVSYAQGWSLVYFLREIVPKNKEYEAKWGRILDVYFRTLKAEVNKEKPVPPAKAAGGADPSMGEPSSAPSRGDAAMSDAGKSGPGTGDAAMADPSTAPPATPPAPGPSAAPAPEPAMSEPAMAEPAMAEPATSEPTPAPAPVPTPAPAPAPAPGAAAPATGGEAGTPPPPDAGKPPTAPGTTDASTPAPKPADAPMADPAMTDPAMDDASMADPAMGGDAPDEPEPGIPAPRSREESAKALEAAVAAAFGGFTDKDWEDLETAWKKEILKIPTPPRIHR